MAKLAPISYSCVSDDPKQALKDELELTIVSQPTVMGKQYIKIISWITKNTLSVGENDPCPLVQHI